MYSVRSAVKKLLDDVAQLTEFLRDCAFLSFIRTFGQLRAKTSTLLIALTPLVDLSVSFKHKDLHYIAYYDACGI